MSRAMRAVVLLLILAWAAVPCAAGDHTSEASVPISATVAGANGLTTTSSDATDSDLVDQYGDPDDLITGNRSNHITGELPPTSLGCSASASSASLVEAWFAWLQLQMLF